MEKVKKKAFNHKVVRGRTASLDDKDALRGEGMVPYHSYTAQEKRAFCVHINQLLADDEDLASVLPMDPNTKELFDTVAKGVLLWFHPAHLKL